MLKMLDIASYLPKLEMLASSISEDIGDRGKKKGSNAFNSPPKPKTHQPKPRKPKVEIVKKPAPVQETTVPSKAVPVGGQPGWVYVPISWVKKDIGRPKKRIANNSKKRHWSVIENSVLLQSGTSLQSQRRKSLAKLSHPITITSTGDAKKATMALEKKRVEFLKYLQAVQDDISGIAFASPKTKSKKHGVSKLKRKTRKTKTSKDQNDGENPSNETISDEKNVNTVGKHDADVEANSRTISSISSVSSEESTVQIKIMKDSFNQNHRAMKESKNRETKPKRTTDEFLAQSRGYFQWSPVTLPPTDHQT